MTDYKRRLIDVLLDERLGEAAVMVHHDEDPAEIRAHLRDQGRLQGDDDEISEAMFDWVADSLGHDELI